MNSLGIAAGVVCLSVCVYAQGNGNGNDNTGRGRRFDISYHGGPVMTGTPVALLLSPFENAATMF
jgi:hypothetical protein